MTTDMIVISTNASISLSLAAIYLRNFTVTFALSENVR